MHLAVCSAQIRVGAGMLVLRADEGSNGTHKNKLESSFPCTCDRITAVWMLNCLTENLKICIFVPQVFPCLSFAYHLSKIYLPFTPFSSVPRLLISWGESWSGGSAGFSFIPQKGEEGERKMLHVWLMFGWSEVHKSRVWRRGHRVQSLTTATSACCLYCHLSSTILLAVVSQ